MSERQRQAIYVLLAALLVAGCTWLWFTYMEKRWIALPHQSDAARENPMLAATRLLTAHQYSVDSVSTLAEAQLGTLTDGTILLAENGGIVTAEQSKQLIDWVTRGNTLVIRPKWSGRTSRIDCSGNEANEPTEDDEEEEQDVESAEDEKPALIEADPISTRLGVELVSTIRPTKRASDNPAESADGKEDQTPPCLARLTLPEARYALQLDTSWVTLQSGENSLSPLFGDELQQAVRVYSEGKGHIVAIANNYFDNEHLVAYDHAELLLSLGALNRTAKHVLVIQRLDMPAWYEALWWHFNLGIISLACGLLLLFWAAVRRFGPVLPEPNLERRSLIEHIDASGRWLWKVPGGRDLLLTTVRDSINKTLQRKAPEVLRMPEEERAAYLSIHSMLPRAHIESALHQPAAKHPIDFTLQIKTLQQLRKHYER